MPQRPSVAPSRIRIADPRACPQACPQCRDYPAFFNSLWVSPAQDHRRRRRSGCTSCHHEPRLLLLPAAEQAICAASMITLRDFNSSSAISTTHGRDALDDDLDAAGVGMDAVRLHQPVLQHRPVEEERVERHVVLVARDPDRPAGRRRRRRGRDWAAPACRPACTCTPRAFAAVDDLVEIGPQLVDRQAAQRVVAAELDQEVGRPVGQHPIQPRGPAGRGVAGNAGVRAPRTAAPRLAAPPPAGRGTPPARPRRSRRPANRRAPPAGRPTRRRSRPGPATAPPSSGPSLAAPAAPVHLPAGRACSRRPGNPAVGDDRAFGRASYPSERRGAGGDPARRRPHGRGRRQRKRGGPVGLRQVQPDVDHRRDRAADRGPGGGRRRRPRRRSTRTGWPCSAATGSASCSSRSTSSRP